MYDLFLRNENARKRKGLMVCLNLYDLKDIQVSVDGFVVIVIFYTH